MAQLYARVFLQILDSSIAEDWQARHIFEDMLKLCDGGVIDMTREAFARRTNVPLDVVNHSITALESPDPASRDQTEEGRRIIRLDQHRDWGWRIVNWEKYDQIRTRSDAAVRQKRFRDSPLPPAPPSLPPNSTVEGEAELDLDSGLSRNITDHNNTPLCSASIEDQAERVYEAYPRKVAKAYAIRCITKAIRKSGFDYLLERTQAYAAARNGEDQTFTPYPSTWFNQERFKDDPTAWTTVEHYEAGHTDAQNILHQKELDRIEAAIKKLLDCASHDAMGVMLSDDEKKRLRELKDRKKVLIKELGMIV